MLKRFVRWAGVGLIGIGLLPGSAAAFTTISTPFHTEATLVGRFPTCQLPSTASIGPVGGLDDGTNIYFTDWCNDTLYRFTRSILTGGGSATAPAASSANGLDSGLALSHGVYYGIAQTKSHYIKGGLYAFNPTTLALTTTSPLVPAASFGTGTPKAIAGDPQSTDLYVSSDNGIFRVQNPSSGHPSVTQFAAGNFDGIDFNDAGTVLYAAENVGAAAGHVVGFDRAGNTVLDIQVGGGPDGIAVAPPTQAVNGVNVSNNLFINNNDGTVERIDTNNSNQVTTVASGGTRGDFAFVDAQGGLDVAQSDSYVRLTPPLFGTPPTNTSIPVITGPSSTPASVLTCSPGSWKGSPGYSFQWRRDGQPLSSATRATYTIRTADIAHWLTCAVTATNAAGSAVAVSNAVLVTPVPGPPVDSGSGPKPSSGPGHAACALLVRKLKAHKGSLHPRTGTVQALKLIMRCDQPLRGVIADTIRITRIGPAHKRGKRGKVITALVHLRSVNFSAAPGIRRIVTEQLSAAIVRALTNARSATATIVLAAANPNGTVGMRRMLTLV